MRNIIIILIITFGFSQDFQPVTPKLPIMLEQFDRLISTFYNQGMDDEGNIIPDSVVVTHKRTFIAYLADEDGKVTVVNGFLFPYLSIPYQEGLIQFEDYTDLKSLKLIPEPPE